MLSFSANLSLLFTDRPLLERFSAARAAGFSAVEIQFPYELDIATLRDVLRDNAQRLVLINVPAADYLQGGDGLACVPGREAEFKAALEQAATYADALTIPQVNVLSGRKPAALCEDDCYPVLHDNLKQAVNTLRRVGSGTLIEAINIFDMPHTLVHSLADMQRLCHDIKGLKMQVDCYHMSRMGEDALAVLRGNLPLIGHIQFADNPGRGEPGSGHIDYRALFRWLHDSDYQGFCGAEYRPTRRTEDTLNWLQWMDGK